MSASSTPNTSDEGDTQLVRESQAGDPEAFEQLVMKHQAALCATLYRFSAQQADMEDLLQETFIRAWRGLPEWKPEKPFHHWLKKIAINVALEFCRKGKRSPFSRIADDGHELLDRIAVEAPAPATDEARHILSHLPPEQRIILTLLHLEQMPMNEIAEHLEITIANAKIKAFRARKKLRSILKHHEFRR